MRRRDDERRPLDKDAAQRRETTKAADKSILPPAAAVGEDVAPCAGCGQRPPVVVVGRERGGHVVPACGVCVDEAVREGCTVEAYRPCRCEDCDLDARLLMWGAENIVLAHDRVVEAMRAMSTPVLRSLRFMLHDDYWALMHEELARRGESL